jgi:hypothetical protein
MSANVFDPSLPLVATSSFQAGEDAITGGSGFDWRARGISEIDAFAMFSSGLLRHQDELPSSAVEPPPAARPVTPPTKRR